MTDTASQPAPAAAISGKPRTRAGIRLTLIGPFGAIVVLTLVSAGMALRSFNLLQGSFSDVTDHQVPSLVAAKSIANESTSMVAQAPMLAAAKDPTQVEAVRRDVAAINRRLQASLNEAAAHGVAADAIDRLRKESASLVGNLAQLEASVRSRIDNVHRLAVATAAVARDHAALDDQIKPLLAASDAEFKKSAVDMVAATDGLQRVADRSRNNLSAINDLQLSTKELVQILHALDTTTEPGKIDDLHANYGRSIFRFTNAANQFKAEAKAMLVTDSIDLLTKVNAGDQNVFALRKLALDPKAPQDKRDAAAKTFRDTMDAAFDTESDIIQFGRQLFANDHTAYVNDFKKAKVTADSTVKSLVDVSVARYRDLLETVAIANLVTAQIDQAVTASDEASVDALDQRFAVSAKDLKAHLDRQAKTAPQVAKAGEALLKAGQGDAGVFAVRRTDLQAEAREVKLLADNVGVAKAMSDHVSTLVAGAEAAVADASSRAHETIQVSWTTIVAVTILILIVAGLIIWLVVGRRIVRRVVGLAEAMRQIAGGNLEHPIAVSGRDELAEMGAALTLFRDSALKMRAMEGEREQMRLQAEADRRRTLADIADSFEASVRQVVDGVSASSIQMQNTATLMSDTAGDTLRKAGAAAEAAESASSNVESVAAAAQQLQASISEIARHAANAAQVTRRATDDARQADQTVRTLGDTVTRIDTVLEVIATIAAQTNLLALNATIEAARAGDAGRGFAVVAGEVKRLAAQTAQATHQVEEHIGAVHRVTSETVKSIRSILTTIGSVDEIAATIAAAVEEQDSATAEIARHVQQAAVGTSQASAELSFVRNAAVESGSAADNVLASAGTVTDETRRLIAEVDQFLGRVRAG